MKTENKRPQNHVTLVTTEGKEVKCTIKTPKSGLIRQVRELQREVVQTTEEFNALWKNTEEINKRLAEAKLSGNEEEIAAAQKERDNVDAKLNAYDTLQQEQTNRLCLMVINIPKGDEDEAPEIDFDNCDQDEILAAGNFFLKRS